jgi:hypothetical protein
VKVAQVGLSSFVRNELGHLNMSESSKTLILEVAGPVADLRQKSRAYRTGGPTFVDEKIHTAMGDAHKAFSQTEWSEDGWKIGDAVLDPNW